LESPPDPNLALSALARRAPRLELGTLDLCFVAALYLRSNGETLVSFPEQELFAVFDDVCSVVEPGSESLRRRATHAIQRLRDQQLLARVDGSGVVKSGEYALTRLASGIAEFFLRDEALTRETLTLLTRTLLSSLELIRQAAERAGTEAEWRSEVVAPLSVTIGDLCAGIERRQRGLDLQQEHFQHEIAALLQADWFGAVDRCQSLLESSTTTLRELNEVLLRDAHRLSMSLQEIQELALAANASAAEEAARRVTDQVDRIAAWGSSRQRAWSEFYQYVHHFLRDVVRLDPTRALTQRLREQLGGKRGQRFALSVANAAPLMMLRDVTPVLAPPPVKRPRAEREAQPEAVPNDEREHELEMQVRALLHEGTLGLGALTARVTEGLPSPERFLIAGRIAEIVARVARPISSHERPWVAGGPDMKLEEWAVRAEGEGT
jgi:chromosome partition protein MukF